MSAAVAARRSPGVVAVGRARIGVELKTFVRNREAMVFTFGLPVLLLVLFGAIFAGEIGTTGVDFRQYFVAGITASGVVSVGFSGLAIGIAVEQGDGTIKRLAGTPMPKAAYFVGKLGMVLVVSVAQTVLMLAIGVALFGLDLPSTPGRWATLAWVFALGLAACALAGVAYSRLVPNHKSAAAVVQPPYLALQFVSGVFFVLGSLPGWLQAVADAFPLRWMASGLRAAFLPEGFAAAEPGGAWHLGTGAAVLAAWVVAMAAVSALTFRWRGGREGH